MSRENKIKMKTYPKIDYWNNGYFGEPCIAFDKLDGSNLRFSWSNKRGWYKFGTRNTMIDTNTPLYGEAISIFLNKYGEDLDKVFRTKYPKCVNFVVFCEFLGENSFAGLHQEGDVMDVVLFDVNMYNKGFLSPYEFLENFGHLDIPKVVYEGDYTEELVEEVKLNNWGLKEGVIVKGVYGREIWMVKLKTLEWLTKVKDKFGKKYLMDEVKDSYEV